MLHGKILDTRKSLLQQKKMTTEEQLDDGYLLFREKFSTDILKTLDGELLLDTLFNLGNRDSLVYWLEFKNDDEFQTTPYGSISGGSAYKFIIFRRSSDGVRSEEHTSELQSRGHLVCRLLLEKKKDMRGRTRGADQAKRTAPVGVG